LTWHLIDGNEWTILGVNAEPVVEYQALVQQRFPGALLLAAGCIDEPRGYLPTDRMLGEGGYEVEGFRKPFGFSARFSRSLESRVITTIGGSRHRAGHA
jgi:hypothetical protein